MYFRERVVSQLKIYVSRHPPPAKPPLHHLEKFLNSYLEYNLIGVNSNFLLTTHSLQSSPWNSEKNQC